MPSDCSLHPGAPQLNCHTCYTAEELEGMIHNLNQIKVPDSPAQKKPKRLDAKAKEGKPGKKPSWRDTLGL